ncbi:MAG: hypothetical protein HZB75_01590 [Candidatus Saccharibacteria bacterium]|nr:MAG: hypothetical protein HZB75_01590 [Candidatus Saccharibacteria bacterium]
MAVAKKKPAVKKSLPKTAVAKKQSNKQKLRAVVMRPVAAVSRRVKSLLARRPHRSFRPTRRRDYVRPLRLPGYWALTNNVRVVLWRHKLFISLLVVSYGVLTVLLVGMASQDAYTQMSEILRTTGDDIFAGDLSNVGQAGLLLFSGITGTLSGSMTEAQRVYAGLLLLFTWLTTVWLLRATFAGKKPKLRDGLYNAGAPILPTFLVGLLLLVQLLPVALAIVGYTSASATGLLNGGIEAMLFWSVALLLGTLSLYWITSTFFALIIVTLPGMYPFQAIKTAGDLVVGRRIRILLRLLWVALIVAVLWLVIMVPIILLDTWIKGMLPAIEWLPVVPVALLVMSTLTVVWVASYVYILYRKVVDDDAAPA